MSYTTEELAAVLRDAIRRDQSLREHAHLTADEARIIGSEAEWIGWIMRLVFEGRLNVTEPLADTPATE